MARVIVVSWGIPLLLGLTYVGGIPFVLLITAICMGCLSEYFKLQAGLGRHPDLFLGYVSAVGILCAWAWKPDALAYVLIASFLTIAIVSTLRGRNHDDVTATIMSLVYIPLFIGSLIFLRSNGNTELFELGDGYSLVACIWGTIWTCDIAAYAIGKAFGTHPLTPKLSPKKTIEGFIAGFVGAMAFMLGWWMLGVVSLDIAVVAGISIGLVGQLGDLVESSLKRTAGVKDTGSFLPGHGGLLDRFDSLLTSAPLIALYVAIRSYFNY